jgi:acyl dehydratase
MTSYALSGPSSLETRFTQFGLEKQPKYKDMGLIRISYEVFKQKGELVLYCEHLQTVKYRDPSAFVNLQGAK